MLDILMYVMAVIIGVFLGRALWVLFGRDACGHD